MRRYSRSEYHKSIKYVIKNKELILRNKVANSMLNSNPKEFWTNVKSINKTKFSRPILSGVIDGAVGDNICNVFEVKYKSLYSAGSKEGLMMLLVDCNHAISSDCSDSDPKASVKHMHNISDLMVKQAVNKLKMK